MKKANAQTAHLQFAKADTQALNCKIAVFCFRYSCRLMGRLKIFDIACKNI
jgi:hypothetical protein